MAPTPEAKHITLVEDEEILANILAEKLSKAGYVVTLCRNGEEGAAKIIAERPDLVLLDILLPKKNGYEVLGEMEKAGLMPQTPVIVISNSGQPVEIEHLQKMGVRDYLVKINFDPDEVVAKVGEVLGIAAPISAPGTAPASTNVTPSQKAALAIDGTVLVVEDDIFIADLLCRKLHESFNVFQASDTSLAEAVLAEHAVDVICLDIILPGKDGYTFLEELKKNDKFKDIPVIILSNLGQREEIERGLKAGAVDYLIKANSSPEEITRHVARLMEGVKSKAVAA